jgi:hypothetical protein
MNKKINSKNISIHSSAGEYLTYISALGNQKQAIEMRYENENIWLTQKMMAELYGVSVSAINQHLRKLFTDGELNDSVIKQYLITASDGKRYKTDHYNLQAIISIGFKIEKIYSRQIIRE